jgi:Zn-dependent protease
LEFEKVAPLTFVIDAYQFHALVVHKDNMFWKQLKIFQLFGVDVKIDTSWIFIAVLVTWSLAFGIFPAQYPDLEPSTYWVMGFLGSFLLFFSIIFHEFAHTLVAMKYGISISSITLFVFGGVANMENEPETPRAELLMAIAGPVASLILGSGFLLITLLFEGLHVSVMFYGVTYYLGLINIILAVFNMIPAFPLDGGRVFRSFLWNKYQDLEKATKKASKYGSGFGTFFMLAGAFLLISGNIVGGLWWILIGVFLKNASFSSLKQVQLRKSLSGKTVSDFMVKDPITIPPDLNLKTFVEDCLYRHHHKLYPVADKTGLLGIIEMKDVKKVPSPDWEDTSVFQVMQSLTKENTLPAKRDAMQALIDLQKRRRSRALVVSPDDRLLGVLTLKDMLDYFTIRSDLEAKTKGG